MANTYTQIHIQIVFSVRNRRCVIAAEWQDALYKYISGIIGNKSHKLIAINGMPDHVHILLGLRAMQSLSDLVKEIKSSSSKWVNENEFVRGGFAWQEGFGAFSYSRSEIPNVINYIKNQREIHARRGFIEEYQDLLTEFEIKFDSQYIFTPID